MLGLIFVVFRMSDLTPDCSWILFDLDDVSELSRILDTFGPQLPKQGHYIVFLDQMDSKETQNIFNHVFFQKVCETFPNSQCIPFLGVECGCIHKYKSYTI
jgi:hypothetical protein